MTKPKNWNKLTPNEQIDYAKELLVTARGHYLLGQALAYAIVELHKVDAKHREYSNIEDMNILSILFEPYYSIAKVEMQKRSEQK